MESATASKSEYLCRWATAIASFRIFSDFALDLAALRRLAKSRPASSLLPAVYRRYFSGFVLAFVVVAAISVQGATRTWDGGGGNALWDTVLNWDNNALPVNGDTVVFGTGFGSGTTIDLNGNRTIATLNINTITGFSITNSTLTISAGDITRTDVAGTEANQTISSAIALGADGNWNIAGSGDFTASGVISGARKLTKSGAGSLILSGGNTFTGEMSVTAGTLSLGHDSAVGAGNFKIGAATIQAFGAARTIGNTVTLDQNFTIGGSLDLTFTGGTVLARDITITTNNTANSTFSGVISGGHKLHKDGAGTLILSGTNTHDETFVDGGVLNIRSNGALSDNKKTAVASGAALEIQGGLNLASEPLELSGTGISNRGALRNVSGNNTWGGTITLTAAASIASDSGTLTISGNMVNGGFGLTVSGASDTIENGVVSGTGGLTKSGAGTLTLAALNTYSGATTINGGTIKVNSSSSLGAITAGLTINAGTLEVSTGFSTTRTITLGDTASTFQIDASQTYTPTTAIGGTGSLTKTGAGTMVLGAAETYSGSTTVSAGTLQINASNRVLDGSALTVNGGTFGVQTFSETVAGVTLASGSITGSGAGTLTGSSYTLQSGSASAILAGSGTVTKNTAGTVTLTGANTLSGAVTVSAGTLTLATSSGSALGSASGITVNSSGTLLLGASNQINDSAAMSLGGGIFAKGNFSEGTTSSVGLGALTLSANSQIDFGTGTVGVLTFASLNASTFILTINNWSGNYNMVGSGTTDRLIFASDQTSNLSGFYFTGYGAGGVQFALGGGFYEVVAAVPEPSTWAAGTLLSGALMWYQRRRVLRK